MTLRGPNRTQYDAPPKRVTVNNALEPVAEDSPEAAFVYLPTDLAALKERLGDDRLASMRETQRLSRAASVDALRRRANTLRAELEVAEAAAAAADADAKKGDKPK